MDRTHILYPTDKRDIELCKTLNEHYEVWNGLPNVEFENAESREGRETLRYKGSEGYIWVFPEATDSIKKGSNINLIAYVGPKVGGKMHVPWVDVSEAPNIVSLEDLIKHVNRLNLDLAQEKKIRV